MLLLLLACDGSPKNTESLDAPGIDDSRADPGDDNTDTVDTPPPDADADGSPAGEDCDETDASVFPGAPERCDGVDQDCDGAADDGVPSDGAGCQDPGSPLFPDVVGTIQVVLETADEEYADSSDDLGVCLGEWCATLDIADWDDRERANFDVHTFEGVGIPRSELQGLELYVIEGSNRWQPGGVAVSFDGEGVYSRVLVDLYLGTEGGDEVDRWSDSLGIYDDSIWPSALTHGPIQGAPFADGARVWFRTDRTRRVELRVAATAEALATATPIAVRYPAVEHDFTETIEVFGLGSRAEWAYDLVVDGQAQGPWTLHPGPVDGTPGVRRIAFGSCTKDDEQPLFADIRAEAPDLFLFVGDNHYGDTDELDALRQQYRWAHSREHRAELMYEAGVYATWDDHDYVGNNTDGSASGKDVALRSFKEFWANGRYGTETVPGVFSAHTYGDLGIYLLDDRYHREDDETLLGLDQEAWLLASIVASDAVFKLVVTGSQWNLDGSSDSWANFPEAQERVVDALSAAPGVVLLSGDIHTSEIVGVPAEHYQLPELTSSPLGYGGVGKVIYIDVDTTVADPTLVARIVDVDGDELGRLELVRSELE